MTATRKIAGVLMVLFALAITLWGGFGARKETIRLGDRQNIVYGILDSDHYPLAVIDDQGKVMLWNRAMEDLTGWTKDQAQEKGIASLICDPVLALKHNIGLAGVLRDPDQHEKLLVIHCDIKNAAGIPTPVRVNVRVVKASNGARSFAIARMDPEKNVVELNRNGSNRQTVRAVDPGVEPSDPLNGKTRIEVESKEE